MEKACICCGEKVESINYLDDFLNNPLDKCTNCEHIQLNQLPTNEEIKAYYDGIYSSNRKNKYWKRYKTTMQKRAFAQVKFISKFVSLQNLNVLDNGCGYGFLMQELINHKAVVKGLEFDFRCVEHCKKMGLEVTKLNVESEIETIESTDLITMSHVLEHLISINDSLDILKKKSKMLFIEVPYYDPDLKDQWKDQLGHINFFNEKSLGILFKKHGFQIKEILRCGPNMKFHWNSSWQYYKRKVEQLAFFHSFDSFWGYYGNPNSKGIWLRAFVTSN